MSEYTAAAERDGKFWLVRVEGEDFSHTTLARHLREVEPMAGDLVATMLEVPADSFGMIVVPVLPVGVREHLTTAERLRSEAADATRRAAEESRAAARELVQPGCRCATWGMPSASLTSEPTNWPRVSAVSRAHNRIEQDPAALDPSPREVINQRAVGQIGTESI